jgi:hypothetical protein
MSMAESGILVPAGGQMRTLLSALEYGLAAAEVEVVQASLEALAALARYHQAATAAGALGLADPAGQSQLLKPLCVCSLSSVPSMHASVIPPRSGCAARQRFVLTWHGGCSPLCV